MRCQQFRTDFVKLNFLNYNEVFSSGSDRTTSIGAVKSATGKEIKLAPRQLFFTNVLSAKSPKRTTLIRFRCVRPHRSFPPSPDRETVAICRRRRRNKDEAWESRRTSYTRTESKKERKTNVATPSSSSWCLHSLLSHMPRACEGRARVKRKGERRAVETGRCDGSPAMRGDGEINFRSV